MTHKITDNLLDRLQETVRWLLNAEKPELDDAMQQINKPKWQDWNELSETFSRQDNVGWGTLKDILSAYNRYGSQKKLFESIIEGNDIENTLSRLLALALPIHLKAHDPSIIVSGKQEVSKTAMSYLITLVAYIQTQEAVQDDFCIFANEFIRLTPKRQPTQKTAGESQKSSHKNEQPIQTQVSLILVFANKHLADLQTFAENKNTFLGCSTLLKQYEWFWFGGTTQSRNIVESWENPSANPNLCWLRLDMKGTSDPASRPDSLKITDWLNTLEQDRAFIRGAEASKHGFNFETSGLSEKGFSKK